MMKSRFVYSFLAAFILFSGQTIAQSVSANKPITVAQSIWKQFSSQEGGFSVLMPGKPTEVKQTVKAKSGAIEIHMFTVERQQDAVKYVVGYADYPDSYIQILNRNNLVEKALDNGRNTALKNARGTLLSEQKISLGSNSGREINYNKPGNKFVKHRIYLVNKRLYQVSVETTKEKQKYLTKSMTGFFNSFVLLK